MKLIEKIKDIIFKIKDYNRSADYFYKEFDRKLIHNKPIYRVDILRAVKYDYLGLRGGGICTSITKICHVCLNANDSMRWMDCTEVKKLFPNLSRFYAHDFHSNDKGDFWWKIGDWEGGRMQFLDWLIEQYRDDKENLRNIII